MVGSRGSTASNAFTTPTTMRISAGMTKNGVNIEMALAKQFGHWLLPRFRLDKPTDIKRYPPDLITTTMQAER